MVKKNGECNGKKKRRVFTVMALLGHRNKQLLNRSGLCIIVWRYIKYEKI